MKDYLLDSRIVSVSETGENQYDFNIESLLFDRLTRQDLFIISVLIQKVLSGVEE